jgi:hypothetical protein
MEILMNFIDNAAKVIVSDAIIDDNCFEFLKNRNNILFIENAYQKYKDIEAIRLRNEHDFRDALMEHCVDGQTVFIWLRLERYRVIVVSLLSKTSGRR